MAMGKERFWYYSVFVGLAYTILPVVAFVRKVPQALFPLVPMGFIWSF